MGLRHIVVVDGELCVKGIITRSNMNEHSLEHYWHEEVLLPSQMFVCPEHGRVDGSCQS